MDVPWAAHLDQALPQLERLEMQLAAGWTLEGAIGSHRDLHPTNLLRLARGELALVDWGVAGPVIPRQEVACFALVFGKRDGNDGYDPVVVSAFIQGYRHAGGEFAFHGPGDVALAMSGPPWTEQDVRRALALPISAEQALLTDALISVPTRLAEQASVLVDCAYGLSRRHTATLGLLREPPPFSGSRCLTAAHPARAAWSARAVHQ